MNYTKPPKTLDEQVDLLLGRGMIGDREAIKSHLATVSYYRLSGYWYPLRPDPTSDELKPGTRFDVVWDRYMFDRQLRLLLLDAIERVEIAVRTSFTYHHSQRWGAFGYANNRASLPFVKDAKWTELQETIAKEFAHSKEDFVLHFKNKYHLEQHLPIWMATEILSFGPVVRMVTGADAKTKDEIAKPFGVHARVFESWLLSLNYARNLCAHHCRLWNRWLDMTPSYPRLPEWQRPINFQVDQVGRRVFGLLTISNYCLSQISPQHSWGQRFLALLERFPHVPRMPMGITPQWLECPLWANAQPAAPAAIETRTAEAASTTGSSLSTA